MIGGAVPPVWWRRSPAGRGAGVPQKPDPVGGIDEVARRPEPRTREAAPGLSVGLLRVVALEEQGPA